MEKNNFLCNEQGQRYQIRIACFILRYILIANMFCKQPVKNQSNGLRIYKFKKCCLNISKTQLSFLRYPAARNFMLSGTAHTFKGYDLYMLRWFGDFQAFISSPALIFWSEELIWLSGSPLFLFLELLLKRIKIGLKLPFILVTVKIRGTGTIKLIFCFKISMLVMKWRLESACCTW